MRNLEAAFERIIHWCDRAESGCLISRYSTGSHGYAQAWDGQTVVLAHRIVWEWWHGPIPDELTVDHTCHVRKCIEVEHLRLLANGENARDNGQVRVNPDTEYRCTQGHVMCLGGDGRRYCRTCKNRQRRERRRLGKRD